MSKCETKAELNAPLVTCLPLTFSFLQLQPHLHHMRVSLLLRYTILIQTLCTESSLWTLILCFQDSLQDPATSDGQTQKEETQTVKWLNKNDTHFVNLLFSFLTFWVCYFLLGFVMCLTSHNDQFCSALWYIKVIIFFTCQINVLAIILPANHICML